MIDDELNDERLGVALDAQSVNSGDTKEKKKPDKVETRTQKPPALTEQDAIEQGIIEPRSRKTMTERLAEAKIDIVSNGVDVDAEVDNLNNETEYAAGVTGPDGRKRGQPSEESRQIVAELVFGGTPPDRIAKILNISQTTLERKFSYELAEAGALRVSDIANVMFRRAKAGDTTAGIFILKTHGGGAWRERKAEQTITDELNKLSGEKRDAALLKIMSVLNLALTPTLEVLEVKDITPPSDAEVKAILDTRHVKGMGVTLDPEKLAKLVARLPSNLSNTST